MRVSGRKRAHASAAAAVAYPEQGCMFPGGRPADECIYKKDCMSFTGAGEAIEARPAREMGGEAGLTIVARVRRAKDRSGWDRLIDFGNGAEKENIVINFQREMMYEVRGTHGEHQALSVHETVDLDHANETFPKDKWMHVSLVHSSDGTASIFWNGKLKARGPVHLPQRVPRAKYYVGRSHWEDDPYFQGDIAELHVFDYALSDTEVNACAAQRSLPASTRNRPILSLADSWVESPRVPIVPPTTATPIGGRNALSMPPGRAASSALACMSQGASTSLQYHVTLVGDSAQRALIAH